MNKAFTVRRERSEDAHVVRAMNVQAFGRKSEADLVDRLRANCPEIVSLVAENHDRKIVGHAMFSPVSIECESRTVIGMALGPIAVDPSMQRRGIGSALIRAGLDELRGRRCPFVVVLGHPEYYPRFGFEPSASRYGIRSAWNVRDDVFMIQILDASAMKGVKGVARYREEFHT